MITYTRVMDRIVATAGIALLLAGCTSGFNLLDYPTPEALLEESEGLYRRGKCGTAVLGLRQLTVQLPLRDSVAIRARFLLAECQFAQSDFLEAARQFRRVADEAPNHPLAANSLLRAGDAQAALWKSPELDPTYGQAAMVTYQEVMNRFPRTSVSRRANLKLVALSDRFAEKEYKNGQYYLRFGAYDSAILYFKSIVTDYGATRFAPLALMRLVEIYQTLDYTEEETETCSNLRRFYADTPGLDDACPAGPPS